MFKESVINGIKKYMQEKTPSNDTSDENSGVITNTWNYLVVLAPKITYVAK